MQHVYHFDSWSYCTECATACIAASSSRPVNSQQEGPQAASPQMFRTEKVPYVYGRHISAASHLPTVRPTALRKPLLIFLTGASPTSGRELLLLTVGILPILPEELRLLASARCVHW